VNVSYPEPNEHIIGLWLKPEAYVCGEAADALRQADKIVICSGDLYGSVLRNGRVKGVNETIKENKGTKLIYVCNLVTKQGTHGFDAEDFTDEVEIYFKRDMDAVICNTKKPDQQLVDKYKGEHSYFVEPIIEENGRKVILADLLVEYEAGGKLLARHDMQETARLIMGL